MKIKKQSMGTNYIFHSLYQMLTLLTPLITTPYISRVLLADGVGAYSYTYTIVQYFIMFGNFGFSTYGQIEIAKCRNNEKKRSNTFWELFFLRTGVFTISLIAYICFAFCSTEYQTLYFVLIGYLLASYIDISWYYFGQDDFKSVSIRNIFVKIISIIGIFIFVKIKADLWKYVLILSASNLIGSIVMWPGIKSSLTFPVMKELHFRRHIRPTIEYFIPNIATSIYTMIDKTMIGFFSDGASQNGYYEQAHKIEQMMVQFLLSISVVGRSRMANYFAEKRYEDARKTIDSSMRMIFFLSIPMCVGLIVVAEDLTLWFLGTDFAECVILLRIFALLLIIISLSNCASNMYLLPNGKQNKFTIGVYTGACINIVCNLFLIPRYGALGATIASVFSEFIILIVFFCFSKEYYGMRKYTKEIFRYSFASGIMVVVIMLLDLLIYNSNMIRLFTKIGLGAITYFIILLMLNDEMIMNVIIRIKHKVYKK